MPRKPVTRDAAAPICMGTGLIALDVVVNSESNSEPQLWAGGSCGNVLTILSYLGWESYPVARLGRDAAAKTVTADLRAQNLRMNYVHQSRGVQTPIILERILTFPNGGRTHRFYWKCPKCGSWLPGYRPMLLRDANGLADALAKVRCFFFDRLSPAALHLAKTASDSGAMVVFEPPSVKDDPQFEKAMGICDILKYSNERARHQNRAAYESSAWLVVETLGADGLRYRMRRNGKISDWKMLPAFRISKLVDAAGAGDWCTSGMVHTLLQDRPAAFRDASETKIVEAMRYGQALGALNCGFEGARGVMYQLSRQKFDEEVTAILSRKEARTPVVDLVDGKARKAVKCICPACRTIGRKGQAKG